LQQSGYKSQYTPFDKFINALQTEETKKTYKKHLRSFLQFTKFEDYSQLITSLTDEEKHEAIADYMSFIKNNQKIATATIKLRFSVIKRFYTINRVKLDWEYLSQFKGKSKGKKIDDRLYTKDEIDQLLLHADLREKVVVCTLLSTGMRVGGLADIKFKDMNFIKEYGLYKFRVYADSEDSNDKYITFCTPECASIINKYLESREKQGDAIKPNSPLIFRKLARFDQHSKQVIYSNSFDAPMDSHGLQQILTRLQRKAAVVQREKEDPENPGRIRKPMMRCHAFRKHFNTICIKNNMNHSVKEKLMGHKQEQGLDFNYSRLTDNELLDEYLKVVNDLTISNEFRLKMENEDLKQKLDNEFATFGKDIETLKKKLGVI
jgi:integrase